MIPLLEKVGAARKPLLVIAEDVDGETLAALIINTLKGALVSCAVKSPDYGTKRENSLEDIAILTGGVVFSEERGMQLADIGPADMGRAKKVIISKDSTTILGGAGKSENIKARIDSIRAKLEEVELPTLEKEAAETRLARLTGGVAVIHIGATTESEMKEKKMRVEDALHATKAATKEGIVPGGGVALIRTLSAFAGSLYEGDIQVGVNIVKKAIEEPLFQIATNAGLPGSVIVDGVKKLTGNMGYDITQNNYVDMVLAGVIDPKKVTRSALQNAASIAALMLTTETLVIDIPTKENS